MELKTWMYREEGEIFALAFSFVLVIIAGYVFSLFSFWGFVGILIVSLTSIRLQQAQHMGNAIRVSDDQFHDVFVDFQKVIRVLDIQNAELFILQDPKLNAFALGLTKCTVVVTSSLVEALTREELFFVLAHEVTHFKAGHTKVSSLLIPIGSNIISGLLFGFWQRKAELTADQAAIVVTRDVEAAIHALLKLASGPELFEKINKSVYIQQIKESHEGKIIALSQVISDHPHVTFRIKNITSFWKENFIQS